MSDRDLGLVNCEGCSALLDADSCRRDIEGVPLCDECWSGLPAVPRVVAMEMLGLDELPTPDVAGPGEVACPCGGLKMTMTDNPGRGGLMMGCPSCGRWLESWGPQENGRESAP